ncbi:hypothetical protein EWM64_g8129 [Hericium alpestre]|uniref:Xylose isomerase-like TIM barrel domain-containing protein n=1 Tax=Hericium alpestre TaxID=135208 RepID=A0A4Y9ZPE1_9AGAM|nr:hypothetical protein EWM64_g8129 [Hericium alpestre]
MTKGYDIRTAEGWNSTMDEFESIIGLKYLRAMHLNDSMTDLGSKTERHENLGLGTMSLQTFAHIMSDPRTQNIPLVLETPAYGSDAVWEAEIAALHMLATDPDQAAVITKGTSMVKAAVKASSRPGKKKAATKTKKGKKVAASEDEDEDEDEDGSDEG